MDGATAARTEDAFRLVHAEAFAEPPYGESEEEVALTFRRFREEARRPGFRAALARVAASGEPAGMALGRPLGADIIWYGLLPEGVIPLPRTLALLELAVRAPWRGRGVARRLHDALLAGTGAEHVVLTVHCEAEPARAAYRSWGYRELAEGEGHLAMMLRRTDCRPGRPPR
ncbi:GNAT family N-acetyltransferase [Streptomyces sp. AV19]|nr:GNAT family N-acetyltransferase [Streptomyces sp. AV19]MBH1932871.1 GNAT family N-acetyltransferase [Streptomyces sp. AV19]MDG4531549.1 GNAT family N-acetyltransferase [Streptomyces sp. AV19]